MKDDKRPFIFLLIVLAGFVAAFFHLAAPIHAVFAFVGIGRSPMSNEIAMGVAFAGAAALYCLLKMTGKLKPSADRGYSIVLAVLGLLFAGFTGAAYMMDTIATWDTPLSVIESVGLSLLAGVVLAVALKGLDGSGSFATSERSILVLAAIVGLVVGFGALTLHVFHAGELHSSLTQGSALAQDALTPLVAAASVGSIALIACVRISKDSKRMAVLPIAALVCIAASVFAARLVFYGIQLSVGL